MTAPTFPTYTEVDLFAGIGGWQVGARLAGSTHRSLGLETNAAARATRKAAGLHTLQDDVRKYGPRHFPRLSHLRGSPPCQPFAQSGNGAGVKALREVREAAEDIAAGYPLEPGRYDDERVGLVLDPLRWVLEAIDLGRPLETVALEQVPRVLPVWETYAEILDGLGYSVATGVLNAEQYGTPQARQRAVLMARLKDHGRNIRPPVALPTPTHSLYYRRGDKTRTDPGVPRYVTMAEALGWQTAGHLAAMPTWPWERPATTVVGSFHPERMAGPGYREAGGPSRQNAPGTVTISLEDALRLQTFPADYPLQGSTAAKWLQVGNAIPPRLAAAVESALL